MWGLCHRPSHGGFFDQGVPEEVFGGLCSSGTWMCLRASHLATLVRNGSCSLRSWMRRFRRWAGTFAGRSAEW